MVLVPMFGYEIVRLAWKEGPVSVNTITLHKQLTFRPDYARGIHSD